MHTITFPQLRRLTAPRTYTAGQSLYKSGQIKSFSLTKERIRARLGGEETTAHEVTIILKEGGFKGTCDCQNSGFCEHVVAVIFKYILEKLPATSVQTLFAALQEQRPRARSARTLSLDTPSAPHDLNPKLAGIFTVAAVRKAVKIPPAYRAGFQLELHNGFKIVPCLVKLRQDGSEGALKPFDDSIKTEPLSRELLFIQQRTREGQDSLFTLLGYLEVLKISDFPLYDSTYYHKIALLRAEKIRLSFRFGGLAQAGTPLFRPCVHFLSDMPAQFVILEDFYKLEFDDDNVCFYQAWEKTFVYLSAALRLVKLLRFLKEHPQGYSAREIAQLQQKLPASLAGQLEIVFPYNSLVIKQLSPQPLLDLKQTSEHKIRAALSFTYGGKDISLNDETSYLATDIPATTGVLEVISRAPDWEMQVYEALYTCFLKQSTAVFCETMYVPGVRGADFYFTCSLADFVSRYAVFFLEQGIALRLKGRPISRKQASLHIMASSDINWLNLELRLEGLPEAALCFPGELAAEGFIEVDGSLMLLTPEDLTLLQLLQAEGLNEAGFLRSSLHHYSLIERIASRLNPEAGAGVARARELAEALAHPQALTARALPATFCGTLRSYQQTGYQWLSFLFTRRIGGCLADDMGLGKTVQTLALLLSLKEQRLLQPCLLVLPVVTLANWEEELKKFAPGISFLRHAGSSRAKEAAALRQADLVLVSYQTLVKDLSLFAAISWFYLVLDEAQYIKNPRSQTAQAVRSLQANYRLALTGTPVENSPLDLWSLLDFLNPGLLGEEAAFRQRYGNLQAADQQSVVELRRRVAPFILRRKKQEVLSELPDKEEIIYYCTMEELQAEAYNEFKEHYREQVTAAVQANATKQPTMLILEALLRLRQMALFPSLVSAEFPVELSCKLEALKNLIEDLTAQGEKVLIFSQFVKVLNKIKDYCAAEKIPHAYLSGSTPNRQQVIDRFRNDSSVRVFLISLKAGGVGINLTEASYVILFDPWWNPAVENQAVDRAHRMGQLQKVTVYKLIAKDTIEEKILQLQAGKKKLTDNLITIESGGLKTLEAGDLQELFA